MLPLSQARIVGPQQQHGEGLSRARIELPRIDDPQRQSHAFGPRSNPQRGLKVSQGPRRRDVSLQFDFASDLAAANADLLGRLTAMDDLGLPVVSFEPGVFRSGDNGPRRLAFVVSVIELSIRPERSTRPA
jgi:hypothetical protein